MSTVVVERSHTLGRDAARAKAQRIAERLAEQYNVRYAWQGDRLQVRRTGASGSIAVEENLVRDELKLGLLLSGLRGTIEREIEQALDKRLS